MFVAATIECFPDLPFEQALDHLVHLEFSSLEMSISETSHLRPSLVVSDWERALNICRQTNRLDLCGFYVDLAATGVEAYRQFQAICRLAKATKVVTITVPSAELGTPFNEEIEHLRKLVGIGSMEGIRVGIKTQVGRISQDPDTLSLMCNHVKGLGITLDPSHFVFGTGAGVNYEPLLKHTVNVYLRDTRRDQLQVRVGQGEIEYGKLVSQLVQTGYDRALCVDIRPMDDADHPAELRKLRLLLESLLI